MMAILARLSVQVGSLYTNNSVSSNVKTNIQSMVQSSPAVTTVTGQDKVSCAKVNFYGIKYSSLVPLSRRAEAYTPFYQVFS